MWLKIWNSGPLWTRNDINAVFALLSDNLSTILIFIMMVKVMFKASDVFLYEYVVPGTAFGLLWGNLAFLVLARFLAAKTGRTDITCLPYGLNTPTMYVFLFSIMVPSKSKGMNFQDIYFIAVASNFLCGVIILCSSTIAPFIQRNTPPIALLSSISGVAIAYLVISNVALALSEPLAGVISILIVLVGTYGLKECGQIGPIPVVVVAVIWGSSICWLQGGCSTHGQLLQTPNELKDSFSNVRWQGVPFPIIRTFEHMSDALTKHIGTIFPVALQTVAGTISAIEIAKKAGDEFDIKYCMAIDGIGTIISSLCGSPLSLCTFPNHPGYRKLGGRMGYSWVFSLVYLFMALFGLLSPFLSIFAMHSIAPSIMFVGIMITTETLDICETRHYAAFIFGIIPCLATWGKPKDKEKDIGLEYMSSGDLIIGLLWSAMIYYLAERNFKKATIWAIIASLFSLIGLIHSTTNTIGLMIHSTDSGWKFALAYLQVVFLFLICIFGQKKGFIPLERNNTPVRDTLEYRSSAFSEIIKKDKMTLSLPTTPTRPFSLA